MTRFSPILLLAAVLLPLAGCETDADDHVHGPGGHTHDDPAAAAGHTHTEGAHHAFAYLGMNGEYEMDPEQAATRDDPRNPSRIRLVTSDEAGTPTRMAFYDHADPDRLVADCAYQYAGSRPDPHYFPAESKTSIWDVFEQTDTYEGDCAGYASVISRSPHGNPGHMHLRYGTDTEELLAMSTVPVDSAAFEPWWALFCEAGATTTCE